MITRRIRLKQFKSTCFDSTYTKIGTIQRENQFKKHFKVFFVGRNKSLESCSIKLI